MQEASLGMREHVRVIKQRLMTGSRGVKYASIALRYVLTTIVALLSVLLIFASTESPSYSWK